MARNAERAVIETNGNESPPTSRRWFLRAAALTATSLAIGACSRSKSGDDTSETAAEVVEPDPIPGPPTVEPIVRVRLRTVGPGEAAMTIGPGEGWLRVASPEEKTTLAVLSGPIELTREDGAWALVDARGFTPMIPDVASLEISPLRNPEPVMVLDGKPYPGTVRVHTRTERHADAYDVVSHVPLEAYLPGVLVRELYNHWHLETHTAQAIAARTFACTESVFWQKRRHFDVTNTEASQVYEGVTTHATSLEAARSTRGVVLAYQNQLVPGYYSSSCGGLAATALDAIGPNPINDVPPLMGAAEEDACVHLSQVQWKVTQSLGALAKRLQAYGKAYSDKPLAELTAVRGIEVFQVNMHGRPTRFVIDAGPETRIEIGAEQLRRAANFTDESSSTNDRLLSSFVDPQAGATHITFNGRGRGHGAGMCQYGAEMMARDGVNAMDILRRYYPGVEIVGSYT